MKTFLLSCICVLSLSVVASAPVPRQAMQTRSFDVDSTVLPDEQSTGIRVPANAIISILDTSGKWSCNPDLPNVDISGHRGSIPAGLPVKRARQCVLIGRVGTSGSWQAFKDNGDGRIILKAGPRSGQLFLGANDTNYTDNKGDITVFLQITPN